MTVSSIIPVNNYTGNSFSTTFDFDFLIEESSELEVYLTDADGIVTQLEEGVDYSIYEVGNSSGSYITYPLANSDYDVLSSDETISLVLNLVIKQENEFKNSLYFSFDVLEWTFDYIIRILQIFSRKFERAVLVSEGSGIEPSELLNDINISEQNTKEYAENAAVSKTNAALSETNAALSESNAAESETNAQIWAEGTDEEIEKLGGTHSAKEWANLYSEAADISLSNLSEVGQAVIDNKADIDLSNLSETGQAVIDNKADVDLSNLSETGQAVIDNKADVDLSNLSKTGKGVIDGQWVEYYYTLANNISTSTATITYSLSSLLPDDGYTYQCIFNSLAQTGSTSGNFIHVYAASDILTSFIGVAGARTRTTSLMSNAGNISLPVGKGRYVNVYTSCSGTNTYSFELKGYRRLGTNEA